MKINLIVALDNKNGFSKDGEIPWINEPFAKEDLKHFRNTTLGSTCIMGRKTYEDIAKFTGKNNVLPGRECIVLSKNKNYYISPEVLVYDSMDHAIGTAHPSKDIFIIGGGSLFEAALKWNLTNIHITKIDKDYNCDKFFKIDDFFNSKYKISSAWKSKEHPIVSYTKYQRV